MNYIGKNFSLGSVEGEVLDIWETISPKSPSKPFPGHNGAVHRSLTSKVLQYFILKCITV
jgi:hypothetical protein